MENGDDGNSLFLKKNYNSHQPELEGEGNESLEDGIEVNGVGLQNGRRPMKHQNRKEDDEQLLIEDWD
jgi:hypothetical protein